MKNVLVVDDSATMDGIRKQSGQVAQAMLEQSRATRDAVAGADNVAKQARRITAANLDHSVAGETLLKSMTEIRAITERNVQSVADARAVSESLKGLSSRMTGMGSDGMQGAAWIKARGGQVFAEAEESCVVYGMPRSVIEAGLCDQIIPLGKISDAILEAL